MSTEPVSRAALWSARVLSSIAALFLVFDSLIHILRPQPVVQAFADAGFPLSTAVGIGVTELIWTALYVFPRTALLGAILLTGHLGGAVASHVRVGHSVFETYIFPVIVGALIWGGLWLRDPVLQRLVPIRRADSP